MLQKLSTVPAAWEFDNVVIFRKHAGWVLVPCASVLRGQKIRNAAQLSKERGCLTAVALSTTKCRWRPPRACAVLPGAQRFLSGIPGVGNRGAPLERPSLHRYTQPWLFHDTLGRDPNTRARSQHCEMMEDFYICVLQYGSHK